ncbi:MAG: RluA family pseudouridine synthase [Mariprofundaceae bacterium]|nr:RluA family pseudouridine synthase [Mariprofundaceae bacterium]
MGKVASNQPQRYVIPRALEGQRLDQALTKLTGLSRSRVKDLYQTGAIQAECSSSVFKLSGVVYAHDVFFVTVPDSRPMTLEAENIALDILFEDEHLLVVNKPADMVVHPSHGHDTGTLVHALLYHCELPGINGVERPGIVHRIDKDTSGSLVIAKTEAAHHGLVELFSTHDIQREYLAWCKGVPKWQQHRIDKPLARHPQHRQKIAVIDHGKRAITDAQLEQSFSHQFSRLRLTLHTGRTHQIRVHLASENIPILADATYARHFNPSKKLLPTLRQALLQLSRQALHAEVLGFTHPITQENILCRAPLPDDLKQLNAALEASRSS